MKIGPGAQFDFLTVLHRDSSVKGWHFRCRCVCGNEKTIFGGNLGRGIKSCGCKKSQLQAAHAKHGHKRMGGTSPTYTCWTQMVRRCCNTEATNYADYGGRGITVCPEWRFFENFLGDMGAKPKGMTLGRIDNEQGYGKDNCRWESRGAQMRNTRRTHFIEFNGERMCLTDWAAKIGISREALRDRLGKLNWSVERALSK